ncbi:MULTISPECIES: tetratricopeptide repeat protein [unclassified Streptomyces]|uniref:tetratricopeptide repeat protein n=1 Tax=unclassified Streptomyces TaxID=2593676 RepID=UPI0011811CFB|nr:MULTISPECIES: tetratricopeptide repeat protein [unclassified Streptomyces]TRO69588.1 tetratricopeptide repeat protein [Streptomyces sp. IB201691-2A2]
MSELGARASGQGRIFQTSGDQYIEEHHHHYGTGGPLFERRLVPAVAASAPAGPDSVRVPLVGRPPGVLRNREELREILGAAVAGPGGGAHVVHGMGGCGKTALAYWLFAQAVRAHGRVGFWINASERMSLRAGMLAVAGDRGATAGELAAAAAGQRAAADLVWHYLDHSADPWLLVLDNADEPTVLEDGAWLRTSPQGTVLVTTRHATSRLWHVPGVTRHGLGVLPLEDAAQVLCDLAPDAGDLTAARKVAARLGGLPLALTLAGSHLAHQLLESWSMDEYDRRLGEESTAIVDRGAAGYGGGSSRHLVSGTWQLSLDSLTAQGLPEATTLLRLMSYWAAEPVPLSLLAAAARGEATLDELEPVLRAEQLEPALRGLLDHSLAELVEADGARSVRVHGVLLDSVATAVPESRRDAFGAVAAELLEAALPPRDEQSPAALRQLVLLAPHASRLLDRAPVQRSAELATRVVRQVYEAGDHAAAHALALSVVERVGRLLGVDHGVTLDVQDVMGRALFRLGRYEESEAMHRGVLARRERLFGPDAPDTLRSAFGLHRPLIGLDRREEAEKWLRRAIAGLREALGEDSPETLFTWTSLPEVLADLGKEEEFETETAALLVACERVLPEDHLTTVLARHMQAYGFCAMRRFEEAEPVARRMLADRIRLMGPEHHLSLSALSLTGVIANGLGRRSEAIDIVRRVIEARERTLGSDHPFVTYHRETLARYRAESSAP